MRRMSPDVPTDIVFVLGADSCSPCIRAQWATAVVRERRAGAATQLVKRDSTASSGWPDSESGQADTCVSRCRQETQADFRAVIDGCVSENSQTRANDRGASEFADRGIADVVTLDWWESPQERGLTLTCVPVLHWCAWPCFELDRRLLERSPCPLATPRRHSGALREHLARALCAADHTFRRESIKAPRRNVGIANS
jgi:hypothetical protein